MAKPITTDPTTLANVITGYGGEVIPGDTFRFHLPVSQVPEVIPKINQMGIGVRKVGEFQAENPTKLFSSVSIATLELYRPQDENPDPLREARFMFWR